MGINVIDTALASSSVTKNAESSRWRFWKKIHNFAERKIVSRHRMRDKDNRRQVAVGSVIVGKANDDRAGFCRQRA